VNLEIGSPEAGILVVNKREKMTSHDVVGAVRRIVAQKQVGHAGTLDPDATGVLILGLGKATRLLGLFGALPKVYECTIVLGIATDTLDASGEVTATYDMSGITEEAIQEAILRLTGEIDQFPPMVSAVKVNGKKLYEYFREGIEVERPKRRVTVHSFEVISRVSNELNVVITCSSGTYIRSLAESLGQLLGGGAHVKDLRRTKIGDFDIDSAIFLEDIILGDIISIRDALQFLPQIEVSSSLESRIFNGSPITRVEIEAAGPGPFAISGSGQSFIAIYQAVGLDKLKPLVVIK
jgi:tRNA pseudouridine55 synthase